MARLLVGTCSWTERTLIESGLFYPPWARSPRARLEFYASQFPIVELDASYYAIPSPQQAERWAGWTPPGFVFNVKAFALFTGHPTPARALPRPLLEALPEGMRARERLYYHHLDPEARKMAWDLFRRFLLPLLASGKLGVVLFQFPPWFTPRPGSLEHIHHCQEMLEGHPLAVEFRNALWYTPRNLQRAIHFLRERGIALVCVDAPQGFRSSVPPVAEATAEVAVVRFHGRNRETWERASRVASERFDYYYSPEELEEWLPRLHYLTENAAEVHILFNTNKGDQGVANARLMQSLLQREGLAPAG